MEKLIEFANAAKLQTVATDYSQIDDSYLFSHITPGSGDLSQLLVTTPLKLGGTLLLLMRKGSPFTIEINLEEYTLVPDSFVGTFPGNVVKIKDKVPDDVDIYALYFDPKFNQCVNINLTAIIIPPLLQKPKSVQIFSREESDMLARYFELMHLNNKEGLNNQLKRSIAASLAAAMFYQLVEFYHRRIDGIIDKQAESHVSGRRHDYVRDFIKLVHLNYVKERSVSFYADKLFISPKYLSLLVKEATGRSAAKWIDEFVLMEAKNMLRFSGKNIQQVAYALNFPTQSSFGKYFKHLTGMSPTEYQKS